VEKLGVPGDVVEVRDGYARNYLIPQGLAYPDRPSFRNRFQEEKKMLAKINLHQIKTAEELRDRLEQEPLKFVVKVGEEDKLYGSVTTQQIADLLAEKGLEVDRRKIQLDQPLKELGTFEVPLKLHADVVANLKVILEKEETE
jgi:large subunit ribosomal protein L9